MKKCNGCGETKDLDQFGLETRTKDGHRERCKVCRKSYRQTEKQMEGARKRDRQRSNRPRNKEKQSVYSKNYYNLNAEERRQASCAYKKTNPGKVNALTAKRLANKKQRTPKWLTSLHFNQISLFYDAAASLTKELNTKFEVDHIVPLQGKNVSGLHVPWNLQVLTKKENTAKGNKFI